MADTKEGCCACEEGTGGGEEGKTKRRRKVIESKGLLKGVELVVGQIQIIVMFDQHTQASLGESHIHKVDCGATNYFG